MKTLKINNIIILLAVFSMWVSSCNKEPKNEDTNSLEIIALHVIGDTGNITNVIATIANDDSSDGFYIIAKGEYENNGFHLKLPPSLAYHYLEEYFEPEMMSNPNAKCAVIESIIGLDSNGRMIGSFEFADETGESKAVYLYSDKTFTVKGCDSYYGDDFEEHYVFECEVLRGWNIIYEYSTKVSKDSVTIYKWIKATQKPSDINFYWKFY